MSSSNQFRLPLRNPYKKTSASDGTSEHRNLGTGKPTNPVPNPYKKQHKPTNDTKHHQYIIDDNDIIDKKT